MSFATWARRFALPSLADKRWKSLTALKPSLTEAQKASYDRDGFLVIEQMFSTEEMSAVRERIFDLVHGKVPIPAGVKFEVQSTADVQASADVPRFRQIWDIVPAEPILTAGVTLNAKLIAALKGLLGPDLRLFRATAMLKPRRIGSDLPYHQDSAYWPIRPMGLVSCWVAVDDATIANGCMRVIPGLHKKGLVPFETKSRSGVTYQEMVLDERDRAREISLEMPSGSCLMFHSLLPHATGPNRSDMNRFAMISSFMSSRSVPTDAGSIRDYLLVSGK